MVYAASPIKRRRATSAEMEERAAFLIDYASAHGPVTVRGLYYQAEVAGNPGIDKSANSYAKVQRQVLQLRRDGLIDYGDIADATRWVRRPRSYDNWEDALATTAHAYRRSLWQDTDTSVEIWVEKDALAGVISQVTYRYDVNLMVSRGFTSETFAYECVNSYAGSGRKLVVYALYDFDRSGQDAARSLEEKLIRFGVDLAVEVEFDILALHPAQVRAWNLPTRAPKRTSPADRRWRHDFACELDAIPPDDLRRLVEHAINRHLPQDELKRLKRIEEAERETMLAFLGGAYG